VGHSRALPIEAMVKAVAGAQGHFGHAHEYLFKTTETLNEYGTRDERVENWPAWCPRTSQKNRETEP
jgi:glutathione-specific gamma-glutamylcyclotransferase